MIEEDTQRLPLTSVCMHIAMHTHIPYMHAVHTQGGSLLRKTSSTDTCMCTHRHMHGHTDTHK